MNRDTWTDIWCLLSVSLVFCGLVFLAAWGLAKIGGLQ